MNFERKPGGIAIRWADSPNNSLVQTFHNAWLRDNCQCSACVHPSNRQKLHSSADVIVSVEPLTVELLDVPTGPVLEVTWPVASLRNLSSQALPNSDAVHKSSFDLSWLREHANSPAATKARRESLRPILWDGAEFARNQKAVQYSEIMQSDSHFRSALKHLKDYGLCFIHNVPTHQKEVEALARRFGCIRETFYGTSWDVRSVTNAKNIAYTSLPLGLHMDLL